jgi:Pyruvate/2-oxoacid:ferredoxin oxidoreductase delta subunit
VRHGDGKRWYLNAANYSDELLFTASRVKFIRDFIPSVTGAGKRWLKVIDRGLARAPRLTRVVGRATSARMKKDHFGQVVPIEEVERILAMVGQVARVPCVCRQALLGREEATCYLLAANPDRLGMVEIMGSRPEAEPFVAGIERVAADLALAEMRALEAKGCIHTVWTFVTPFVMAVCNCDPAGCLAMNYTRRGFKFYFPAEEVASVDSAACSGCRECARICLFSAVSFSESGAARIDPQLCQGCGICRSVCGTDAIALSPR